MFQRSFCTLNFALFVLALNAQDLSLSVVSSAGSSDRIENLSIDWTVGEIAISSMVTSGEMYTEGFHQPLLLVEHVDPSANDGTESLEIRIQPNPVVSILRVEVDDPLSRILDFEIIDLQGRILEKIRYDAILSATSIEMRPYPAGLYLLRVVETSSGKLLETYKISKLQ